jgi:hypothetical protein
MSHTEPESTEKDVRENGVANVLALELHKRTLGAAPESAAARWSDRLGHLILLPLGFRRAASRHDLRVSVVGSAVRNACLVILS